MFMLQLSTNVYTVSLLIAFIFIGYMWVQKTSQAAQDTHMQISTIYEGCSEYNAEKLHLIMQNALL